MQALNDFKAFLLRGNVVDLAVAFIIGAAFGTVVSALVKDLITPLIGAFGKSPDFSQVAFTINHSKFFIGDFINAVISFIILAAVIFFFVVRPVNTMIARSKQEPPPDPSVRNCPFCFNAIPAPATRCGFCTSAVEPVAIPVAADATAS